MMYFSAPETKNTSDPNAVDGKKLKLEEELRKWRPKGQCIEPNKVLVLWRDKWSWQTFNQTNQKKERIPKIKFKVFSLKKMLQETATKSRESGQQVPQKRKILDAQNLVFWIQSLEPTVN